METGWNLSYAHILADGDEFHFRRDDAGAGVGKLGDDLAGFGAQEFSASAGRSGRGKGRFILVARLAKFTVLV